MKPIIIICGPTATGKTGFSIDLAKKFIQKEKKVCIINFDSLCFYHELLIGTARPTEEEMKGLSHELIGLQSISSPLNAASFRELALAKISKLHEEQSIPILVGGSGFYLRALVKGMYDSPTISIKIKKELEILYQGHGIKPFREYLKKNDFSSFQNIHENDHYRTMRAVEYHRSTKQKFSQQKDRLEKNDPYDFSKSEFGDWELKTFYLDIDKEKHWKIIQKRTAQMIKNGLIDEVSSLLKSGFTGTEKPLLSVGYKETQQFLTGKLKSKQELEERINISTRQLAKSQRTFFSKITPKLSVNSLEINSSFLTDTMQKLERWTLDH